MAVDASRFTASGTGTVDANGRATITLGPHGEKWEIDSIRVYVQAPSGSQLLEGKCIVYHNLEAAGYNVDGTEAGSTGDTSDTTHYLEDGNSLIFVWSGADATGTANAVVRGWRSVPDRGFRAVH